jgi:N-acetyl-alpha-D-muramate 1-phosphate uridylyltransferase
MLPVAILAGGLATRLRPVTETIPKALVEIAGEPFLAHQLRLLARAGYRRAVLCVGYRADQIREFAGDGRAFGIEVEYSLDGPQLLGTAGAIRRALPLLGEAFATVYGDSYLTCDYAAAERVFLESGKLGLMTVYRNEDQWDTSNVEFAGGRIVAYDKANRTPAMRHIDYGLGMFRRAAFDSVPAERPADLAALYQELLARGELAAWESPDRFYEIGSPEGIRGLAEFLSR